MNIKFKSTLLIVLFIISLFMTNTFSAKAKTPNLNINTGPIQPTTSNFRTEYKLNGVQAPLNMIQYDPNTIWFTEYNVSRLYKFDLTNDTLTYVQFPVDITPLVLEKASDGSIWFIDYDYTPQKAPDYVGRFDPSNDSLKLVPLPSGASPVILKIHDNFVWVSLLYQDVIAKINMTDYSYSQFKLPCKSAFCGPAGMAFDKYGNFWYADTLGDFIVKQDHITGNYTFYPVPYRFNSPVYIQIDKNDNLWTGSHAGDYLLSLNIDTGKMKMYASTKNPPGAYPVSGVNDIQIADNGDIWFSEHFINKIGRLDIKTQTIHEYTIPVKEPLIQFLMVYKNKVWYAEEGGIIGYLDQNKIPSLSITGTSTLNIEAGKFYTIDLTIKYISGIYPKLSFQLFGEVRRQPEFQIFNIDNKSISLGQVEHFKLRFVLGQKLILSSYYLVYGIRNNIFSATSQVYLVYHDTNFLLELKISMYFVILLILVIFRKKVKKILLRIYFPNKYKELIEKEKNS